MDPVICTYINTATNVIAFLPIYFYADIGDIIGALLCTFSLIASVLMHISETKHNLPGVLFKEYSNILLNIDRLFALILFCYGIITFINNPDVIYHYYMGKDFIELLIFPIVIFSTGAIASYIGENTDDLKLYTLLHTIWHICAYGTLAYVIKI